MNIGILDWTNEHSKGEYPLKKNISLRGVIVDARFIQFAGFVPVLNYIKVESTRAIFNITFDRVVRDVIVTSSSFVDTKSVRIFETDDNLRCMGSITVGQGFLALFSEKVGVTIQLDAEFSANTVVGINPKSGIFTFQGRTEDINMSAGDLIVERDIFVGVDSNISIWNAVSLVNSYDGGIEVLKTINGIAPINNQIKILDSTIIKVAPSFNSVIISLANSPLNDNIAPTQSYE